MKKTWFDRAKELIYGEREKNHGDPRESLKFAASLWRKYLRGKGQEIWLDEHDLCMMMVMLKITRSLFGEYKEDDYIDMMGYIGLVERLHEDEKE